MKKQYVGISRDHSGSMSSLRRPAIKDYNDGIAAIKVAASDNDIDTVVSVVSCGIRSGVRREIVNSSISSLRPITSYDVDGSTPLFDSVGELIDIFKATPDYNNPNVTFLVMAITDGEENASRVWKHKLGEEIRKLQASDRWTFVFRVPQGHYRRTLESLSIPSGNIQEWETTERGLRESSGETVSAISNYYKGVSRGIGATRSFYADMSKVSANQVVATMKDISDEVAIYPVKNRGDISSFIVLKTRKPYTKGTVFYQLSKPEKAVQDYKVIVVRNKNSGAVFGGGAARQLLNLPTTGTFSLKPGDHGDWDIFVQSTSLNRVLLPGTSALYWENA